MVFDDEFFTVPFMREGIIPPNLTDLVQHSSQSSAPDNLDLKDTWLTTGLEEGSINTTSCDPIDSPDNNRKVLTLFQSVPNLKESPARKVAYVSEAI